MVKWYVNQRKKIFFMMPSFDILWNIYVYIFFQKYFLLKKTLKNTHNKNLLLKLNSFFYGFMKFVISKIYSIFKYSNKKINIIDLQWFFHHSIFQSICVHEFFLVFFILWFLIFDSIFELFIRLIQFVKYVKINIILCKPIIWIWINI